MRSFSRTQYIAVSLVLIFSAGCAAENRYSYNEVVADLTASGSRAVGVAAHDQREYVKDREKNPNFVGLQRGGFGNPFNITTASGQPLAMEMTEALVTSLAKKGYKAMPVAVTQDDDLNAALQKLKDTKADRLILLTLNEWKSDTYMNTVLHYDVTMKIYDQEGKVLTVNKIQGKDDLGGSSWNPQAHAKQTVPRAFKEKIEELLNSPSAANALQ
jgi:hypothetical protein